MSTPRPHSRPAGGAASGRRPAGAGAGWSRWRFARGRVEGEGEDCVGAFTFPID
jgi:hypothetical protein